VDHNALNVFEANPNGLEELNRIDPLKDSRWSEFVARHPQASVFHSAEWLEALRCTYGYLPVVYTTTILGSPLQDGLVLCQIESWMTGRRLVSLPFSDHCDPLVDDPDALAYMLAALRARVRKERWGYLEMRPLNRPSYTDGSFQSKENYLHHQLDLTPSLDYLFRSFHKNSTQRKIKRAQREGLVYREGANESLLRSFYSLFLITRRRHRIPPQPILWFRNLAQCFKDALQIRMALKDDKPFAAILTLRYKNTLTYKYGCSDPRVNSLGGTQMLFWRAIQDAKSSGLTRFDLGRSSIDNTGLATFKDRLGATRSDIVYVRYYAGREPVFGLFNGTNDWKLRIAKGIFARTPDKILSAIGNVLYRHIG
jgi:CelD/BcsL family acetyltransferase involved in cellulose biosynthesis